MDENMYSFENFIPTMFHIVDRYCDDTWYVPLSDYKLHNFMFVVAGEGTSITDGNRYDMHPGMLVYHSPEQSFGFETSKTNPMHCFGVNFQVSEVVHDTVEWSFRNINRLPFENYMSISDMDILIRYFTDLVDVWDERSNNCQLKLRSIFLNILYEISNQMMLQQSNAETLQSIEQVKSYIRKYYTRHLTLDSLAGMTGLNPNYFGSVFKKYTGKTPVEYINFIRVEKASELLSIGYSAAKASSSSGFNDPFYFSKVFKKIKGVSPRDYRKSPLNFC